MDFTPFLITFDKIHITNEKNNFIPDYECSFVNHYRTNQSESVFE